MLLDISNSHEYARLLLNVVAYTILSTSTPWPGAGRTAGSITDDRQWLLPNGYPVIQDKNNDNDISSPKENAKPETPIISEGPKKEKCGWGTQLPFL